MSVVILFLGWLSWDKNVDYVWAAWLADNARDNFQAGRFQDGHRQMSQAIDKAPMYLPTTTTWPEYMMPTYISARAILTRGYPRAKSSTAWTFASLRVIGPSPGAPKSRTLPTLQDSR